MSESVCNLKIRERYGKFEIYSSAEAVVPFVCGMVQVQGGYACNVSSNVCQSATG